MLTWYEENGIYIGFDDDCPRYFVRQDEEGWYWEDTDGYGCGGYDTAEEAMEEAEGDMPKVEYNQVGFTLEELDEIKACMEAHERMEKEKGLA